MSPVVTRSSVLVKTRYNVATNARKSATDLRMADGWYERFVEVIKADGRDLKAISLAAKCGENYVQQMIRENKRPSVDKFMAILDVIGSASAVYVLLGVHFTPEDDAFFRAASQLDPDLKAEAYRFFQKMRDAAGTKEPPPAQID